MYLPVLVFSSRASITILLIYNILTLQLFDMFMDGSNDSLYALINIHKNR